MKRLSETDSSVEGLGPVWWIASRNGLELPLSPLQWWMDDTWMVVDTKLRVLPWLLIATIVEGHHMSTTCAAWGRPRCPHVMTTTLCVNAQELR